MNETFEVLVKFVTLLAWGAVVLFSLRGAILLYWDFHYTELHARVDALRGIRRTFPWARSFEYAFIAGAWLVASSS